MSNYDTSTISNGGFLEFLIKSTYSFSVSTLSQLFFLCPYKILRKRQLTSRKKKRSQKENYVKENHVKENLKIQKIK